MTGWIEPRGNKYRARWRENGEVITVTCDTETQAQAVLDDVATDRRRGTYIDPRGGRITVKDWAQEWLEVRPHLKDRSAVTEKGIVNNHIVTALGAHQLDQVTKMVVRRWVAALQKKGLAAKTVRNCHGVLHSLMAAAVDEKLIASNPCTRTGLPKSDPVEMHFLTSQEVDRLVAATPEHYKPLILTLVGTGIRWGEAAGLRRRRLDVLERKLEVIEALADDGKLTYVSPKSRSSRRVVSLPARVVDVLIPLAVGEPDGPVFTTERGALLRRSSFGRNVWTTAVEKAKLPATLRVHDLRHTHAAHLISAGVPLTAVQRRLGHASISVTSDVYGHLLPEVDERLIAAVDGVLGEPSAPSLLPTSISEAVESPGTGL